MEIWALQNNW